MDPLVKTVVNVLINKRRVTDGRYLYGFDSLLVTYVPTAMQARSQTSTMNFATDFIDAA